MKPKYWNKFWKRDEKNQLTKIEETVAKQFIDIESPQSELSSEIKGYLKYLYIDSVKEIEVPCKGGNKSVILIKLPFNSAKVWKKVNKPFLIALENALKKQVLVIIKRTIQSKWIKTHRSQKRPINRTLTAVHEAILEDLVLPSAIIAKRIRYRVDGTKFIKLALDENDRSFLEDKIELIQGLYKQLTSKEVIIAFKKEKPFYTLQKN